MMVVYWESALWGFRPPPTARTHRRRRLLWRRQYLRNRHRHKRHPRKQRRRNRIRAATPSQPRRRNRHPRRPHRRSRCRRNRSPRNNGHPQSGLPQGGGYRLPPKIPRNPQETPDPHPVRRVLLGGHRLHDRTNAQSGQYDQSVAYMQGRFVLGPVISAR